METKAFICIYLCFKWKKNTTWVITSISCIYVNFVVVFLQGVPSGLSLQGHCYSFIALLKVMTIICLLKHV